ncbi:S49 family peptidase [Mesorhizobium sp. WSM4962]|uniref:S49 family peptidase n=1 Tax=Mesorhizobium sp. WSM4962 TaxID=3038548 RepID=UPI0024173E31|nr:S49 family peptidase [Mesorhizobium sp. WSM4962]MDG4903198.1 S49 family peptidase [Mesorhizobium sp. WSM4962]
MAHEINRILRAFAMQPLFIEAAKGHQIAEILALRAAQGPRADSFTDTPAEQPAPSQTGNVAILRLFGPILPRAEAITDISQPAALMTRFQAQFRTAASDPRVTAIVIDIDSPGGQADLVPETVAMIRAARRSDRPIVAIADTLACSAAYWLGCGADEFSVTPSGLVGSIGAYVLHQDVSEALTAAGVKNTFVAEGPRKVEGNPFEPLDDAAKAWLQGIVKDCYDMFVADVAKARGVPASVVRADPETSDKHMGGGRSYPAKEALRLGMVDRIETLDQLVTRLQRRGARSSSSARASLL